MRKLFAGLAVSLLANTAFAQDQITFDVVFDTVYASSGGFATTLGATQGPPFNLSGQVTLTTNSSTTKLTVNDAPGAVNTLTLNGSWTSEGPFEPANTWSTHTYDNAVFDFGESVASGGLDNGYVAVDFLGANPVDWPLQAGTASDGYMSDHGPASNYGGTCPYTLGCLSANPFELFPPGTVMWDPTANNFAGGSFFPDYANAGNHELVGGTYTGDNVSAGLGSDNGLDAITFDMVLEGGQVAQAGGKVRFLVFSDTATTAYMVEGTIVPVPVPAAVWLFGSALGLLGWMRRRAYAS